MYMRRLAERLDELDKVYVSGFKRLKNNDEFYERIKTLLSSAHTVHIASLFFGCDGRMVEILDILEERKRKRLSTVIFVDKNRSQETKSLRSLDTRGLASMFHFVDFSRLNFLPRRVNEVLKVFHTKALVFDNTVLLSGANMDDSYMKNRLDRYLEVESHELASLIKSRVFGATSHMAAGLDKSLPVCIWMFKEHQEISTVRALVEEDFDEMHVSTGYLNLPEEYLQLFVGRRISLYASCPGTSSFNAFGLANRLVGPMYSYSFHRTLECVPTISAYEFSRNGYTFHSKGK